MENNNLISPGSLLSKPNEGEGYMVVARELLPSVEALSVLEAIPFRGCAMIAAHALECALKAFLWQRGKGNVINRPEIRHDLVKLWKIAFSGNVMDVPEEPPDWVKILSSGHGGFFYLRYQKTGRDTVAHGGQALALVPMAAALGELIDMVEHAIKGLVSNSQ